MGRLVVIAVICLGLMIEAGAAGIRYGMTREEVEEALGEPQSVLKQGSRFVLLYPKAGRVEFEGGVVVNIKNVPLDIGTSAVAPSAAPTAAAAPAPAPANSHRQPAAVPGQVKAAKPGVDAQRQLEALTEQLAHPPPEQPLMIVPPAASVWGALGVGLLVRTLVTAVVLKLAFKWSDVHAEWSQMFIPALADSGAQTGIAAGVFVLWRTQRLFFLDTAASYLVLLVVLMKTTHACTLSRAVAVAGAAKIASLVVWTFLSVAIMRLLF